MTNTGCGWRLALGMGLLALGFGTSLSQAHAGETPIMSPRALLSMATLGPDEFLRQWTQRRDEALAAPPGPSAGNGEEIRHQWSAGIIDYPYFHWRETGEKLPEDWAPRREAIQGLSFDQVDATQSEGFRWPVAAWLHDAAWRASASDARYGSGDNRSLRARIDTILARDMPRDQARDLVQRELETHIDENGARDLMPQIETLIALGGDPGKVEEFRKAVADDAVIHDDHPAYVYRTAEGVDLRLHASAAPNGTKRPAMVWFHGGSGDTGHWSHCYVICKQAEALGMLVLQVEYRTAQRFFATPADGRQDAEAALAWVTQHADQIGVDRRRIVVAGFSTGGSMASQLALHAPRDVRGAIVMSDCFRPSEDAWYRRAMADAGEREWPPQVAQLRKRSPPMLMLHARDDEMCPFPHAVEMRDRADSLGQRSRLVEFESGGHFFIFSRPDAREQVKREVVDFLASLSIGIATKLPSQ